MPKKEEEAVVGGLRDKLGGALDGVTADKLERLVAGIFNMKRSAWAYCPDCRKKVQVDAPDYVSQAKAIATLADQALGRPAETVRIEGGLLIEARRLAATMPLREIPTRHLEAMIEDDMSPEERKALAEANEAATRGDFEPLRALGYRNMAELSDAELRALAEPQNAA